MEWEAELHGDDLDLEELMRMFPPAGDTAVTRDELGRYWLKADLFSEMADADQVRQAARDLVARLNGLALLEFSNARPVAIGAIKRIDGERSTQFVTIEPAILRLRPQLGAVVIRQDGTREPVEMDATEKHRSRLATATANEEVAAVLRILGARQKDWRDLFVVVEKIEHDTNGKSHLLGGPSRKQLDLFNHTANSYAAIGDDARHGHTRIQPPVIPMTLIDAQSLVRELVTRWIAWVSDGRPTAEYE